MVRISMVVQKCVYFYVEPSVAVLERYCEILDIVMKLMKLVSKELSNPTSLVLET